MTVGTLRLPARDGVQSSTPAGGATPLEESAWLRSRWSRALATVAASVAVGVAAGFGVTYAVAALVGVAVVVLVLVRPVIAAYVLVAVVPPVSGLRAGLAAPGVRPSEALLASVGVLLLVVARPGSTPRWGAFDWCAFGYVVANAGLGAGHLVSSGSSVSIEDVGTLLGPMQFFILYRAVLSTLTTADQRRVALKLLLLSSVPVSVLGLLQQARVPGIATLLAAATDSQSFLGTLDGVPRATGPFAIWHDLGSYLFVIVLLGVALLVNQPSRVMKPRTVAWILVLAGCALLSTVTITPIVGSVVGVLALALTARPRRRWVTRVAAFVGLLCVAFGPILIARYEQQYAFRAPVDQIPYLPETIDFRIAVWLKFVPLLADHLLAGYGPGMPPYLAWGYTESVYVTMLLRGGLPLLFLYVGLMVALALAARDLRNDRDASRRAVAQVLLLAIVLMAFMHLVYNYFVDAGFPFLFWILAGLLMGGTGNQVRVRRRAGRRSRRVTQGLIDMVGVGRRASPDAAARQAAQPGHLHGVGTVLRGFAVLSSATVLTRLIGFVAVAIFARRAGPEAFGTFAFALALASFVVGVPTNFGIGLLGIRSIARDPMNAGKIVGEAIAAQAIIAVAAVASLVTLVSLLSTDRELIMLTPFVAVYWVAYRMTVDWALQGLQRLRAVAVARLAGQLVFGVVTPIILVRGPDGAVRYAAAFAAGATITAIVAFAMVRRLVGPVRISWELPGLWDLAKRAAPLGFSVIMINVYYTLDQVLLGLLTDKAEVGQYAAATKVPAVLSDFVVVWMSVVYPHASKMFTQDPASLRLQLGGFTSLGIAAALPVAVGSAFVGTDVMTHLFGPAYGSAGPPFVILMVASAIAMVKISYTSLAMAAGQERAFALAVSAASIANVSLNLLLIPFFGSVGAAIATVAAELVILVICARRVIGVIGRPVLARRRILGAAVATAAMSVALIGVPTSTSVWLRIATGAIVFAGVAVACGAVRREDLSLLRHGT